jgi:dephospho-CoA kinase
MLLLGVTGGVGVGKGTVAEWFSSRGFPVADTDLIARNVSAPGGEAHAAIVECFAGEGVVAPDGQIDRAALAKLVFGDLGARRRLEAILHPVIRSCWKALAEGWSRLGVAVGVVVVPLLFETGVESEFHHVLCAACSGREQRARLARRGWDLERAEGVISAQWPQEKKMCRSSHVVWTEHDPGVTLRQLEKIARSLQIWVG